MKLREVKSLSQRNTSKPQTSEVKGPKHVLFKVQVIISKPLIITII